MAQYDYEQIREEATDSMFLIPLELFLRSPIYTVSFVEPYSRHSAGHGRLHCGLLESIVRKKIRLRRRSKISSLSIDR